MDRGNIVARREANTVKAVEFLGLDAAGDGQGCEGRSAVE